MQGVLRKKGCSQVTWARVATIRDLCQFRSRSELVLEKYLVNRTYRSKVEIFLEKVQFKWIHYHSGNPRSWLGIRENTIAGTARSWTNGLPLYCNDINLSETFCDQLSRQIAYLYEAEGLLSLRPQSLYGVLPTKKQQSQPHISRSLVNLGSSAYPCLF
jgi:hypothetical protein